MSNFVVTIIGGVVVAALVSWLGIGKNKAQVVIVNGSKVKKSGKWIIIISSVIIIWGFLLLGNNSDPTAEINLINRQTVYGFSLILWGGVLFIVGKIIVWFQKP